MIHSRTLVLMLALMLIGGCASIPEESPELSQEIGKRIANMRTAHMTLVHRYFDLKRDQVDSLFQRRWIPAYAEHFFSQDPVSNYWDKLVSENDKEERVRFLITLGPRMLERIRNKRAEFMKPLDRLETRVVDSLQREYRLIMSANHTLTSFLANSSKVTRNRERYLEMLGLPQETIGDYVDRVDRRSEQIIRTIRNDNLY